MGKNKILMLPAIPIWSQVINNIILISIPIPYKPQPSEHKIFYIFLSTILSGRFHSNINQFVSIIIIVFKDGKLNCWTKQIKLK